MNNGIVKSLVLHIKYPYAAAVIVVMWLGMAVIIGLQEFPEVDLLIVATAVASLVVATIGFASPK